MDRIYYIYKWYFKDTGKVFYIGKGKGRRYRDKKDRNDKFIKYVNKFDCTSEKIIENLTEQEAYEKEIELISYYKSIEQCECNFTPGGDAPPTFYGHFAPNRRIVIQLSLNGEFIKEWECIKYIEVHFNISNSLITRVCRQNKKGDIATAKGFIWIYKDDYEHLENLKVDYEKSFTDKNGRFISNRGKNKVPILQYRLDGIFVKEWESAQDIQEKLGYRKSGICMCCKGKYKTSEGYIWRYKDDSNLQTIEVENTYKSPTPVVKLDMNKNFIKKYKNATEAITELGKKQTDCSKILDVCKGKRKSAYGYIWTYEYDYIKNAE